MTQWVERPELGRDRGPVALVRAWIEVLVRPGTFFASKVAPGDQTPGLTFAAAVVLAGEGARIAVFDGSYPVVSGQPLASAVLWLLIVTVLIAPAGIHLTAALQTVILVATVEERAGVSETVQVICYALAPVVFVGVPSPAITSLVVVYGITLLVLGTATVHRVPVTTAVAVAAVPAILVFGYGFGGNEALLSTAESVWAWVEPQVEALVG